MSAEWQKRLRNLLTDFCFGIVLVFLIVMYVCARFSIDYDVMLYSVGGVHLEGVPFLKKVLATAVTILVGSMARKAGSHLAQQMVTTIAMILWVVRQVRRQSQPPPPGNSRSSNTAAAN